MRCQRRARRRAGFTLVELLVVTAIISILMGLLLPAIQQIRETARGVSCRNHVRQLGLAALNYETAFEFLPGPWFNADPGTPQYISDRGLFVQILPQLEEANAYDRIRATPTTFDPSNQPILANALPILSCPSTAAEPARLMDIAATFSGPAVPGLESLTCDYIGNGGYISDNPVDPGLADGPVGVQLGTREIPRERSARILDGLSNTLLFWESIGGIIIPAPGIELDVNMGADASFSLTVVGPPIILLSSSGTASTKSYIHSWAGLRIGNIQDSGGSVINVGNKVGQPCSWHPGGVYSVMTDGSVRLLSKTLSPKVAFAMASARGREVVPDF
jgi:prepilin-type N-terminal cleavage/methylation domain-containing protein